MSLYNKLQILSLAIFLGFNCAVSSANAQGLGNAPYSSIGLGELYNDAFSANTGTGQAGVSAANGFQINNLNPALWVRSRFTTLDFGLIGQYKDVSTASKNQKSAGGNLAYVALSFPVARFWSLGASLKPYSFVDYQNVSTRNVSGTSDKAVYLVSGSGGLNKASFVNSFEIGKYLTVGLETSLFFGNIKKSSEATLPKDIGAGYLVSLNDRTVYKDFSFKAGFAARVPVNKEKRMSLNVGGAYSFASKISGNQTTSFDLTLGSFPIAAPDTIVNNKVGYLKLPSQFQVGVSLEWLYKLTISADYSHQSWSQYRSFEKSNDGLIDVGRFHFGVEYIPDFRSISYFNHIRYRAGFSHGKSPYVIDNKNINDTNVSLGAALPMGSDRLHGISVSIVGGQRGIVGQGLIRERYARVVVGLTLLERWFQKQKLD